MSVENPSNPLNVGVEAIAVVTGCFLAGILPTPLPHAHPNVD